MNESRVERLLAERNATRREAQIAYEAASDLERLAEQARQDAQAAWKVYWQLQGDANIAALDYIDVVGKEGS